MAVSFKGAISTGHHAHGRPLTRGVSPGTRHVEARMLERGVHVDHATINRWVVTYSPTKKACHRRKRLVWISFGSTPKLATKPGSEKGIRYVHHA